MVIRINIIVTTTFDIRSNNSSRTFLFCVKFAIVVVASSSLRGFSYRIAFLYNWLLFREKVGDVRERKSERERNKERERERGVGVGGELKLKNYFIRIAV